MRAPVKQCFLLAGCLSVRFVLSLVFIRFLDRPSETQARFYRNRFMKPELYFIIGKGSCRRNPPTILDRAEYSWNLRERIIRTVLERQT